jgi:hypothetical protein
MKSRASANHAGVARDSMARHQSVRSSRAEQLAEPVQALLERARSAPRTSSLCGNARAAGRDDRLDRSGIDVLADHSSNLGRGRLSRPADSTTVWPASISSSAIARPLVSVSIVRVSLIVNTKHATLDSACERCS